MGKWQGHCDIEEGTVRIPTEGSDGNVGVEGGMDTGRGTDGTGRGWLCGKCEGTLRTWRK